MKEFLINLLKPVAVFFYDAVVAVPLPLVRVFFLGMLVVLAIWLLTLPPQRPEDESADETGGMLKDLRYFGLLLLAMQSVFYLVL